MIADQIRRIGLRPGEALPSIRALAARFGAGRGAVSGAVRLLAREGWLVKEPYGRAYVRRTPGPERHCPLSLGPRSISDHIATELRGAIAAGEYALGEPVPTIKELRHRFGCSHYPVARALADLEARGLLERKGRGYAVPTSTARRRTGPTSVYFFGPATSLRPELPATAEFMAPLEREVQMLGWGPIRYYVTAFPTPATAPPPSAIAGIVTVQRESPELWESILGRYRNIPLVTFDAWERLHWDRKRFARHEIYHPITPDNRAAGSAMARLALGLGHRHVAFFSHVPLPVTEDDRQAFRWLLLRMDGIEEVLGSPGTDAAWEVHMTSRGRTVPAARPTDSPAWWEVRSDRSFRRYVPTGVHSVGLHAVEMLISHSATARHLEPRFRDALSRGRATFWLCVNDEAAVAAVHFLHRHRIRVPGDIEVAGFDNTRFAFAQGITSYDLGIDRAGVVAARCLAKPGWAPRDSAGFIRLPGRVVLRETTKK